MKSSRWGSFLAEPAAFLTPPIAPCLQRLCLQVRTSRLLREAGLLDRVGDLNRRHWVPVIARVIEGFDAPGAVTHLDLLMIDLGRFAPDELDAVPARLEARLRDVLADRLKRSSGGARHSSSAAMLDAFGHYLDQGAWPYGSGIDVRTAPGAVLGALIENEPTALVAMLRARGSSEPVLRRLVRQIPDSVLRALLHRLEPVHAAYVLAYVQEVRASHGEEPLVPASAEQVSEMLWTIVLRDALGQSGLQANRKAFLRRLLRGLAEASGTSLSALLRQLRRGLLALGRHRSAPGSLVEILGQLMADEPAMLVDAAALARLSHYLFNGGDLSGERLNELRLIARAVERVRPAEFAWLVRRLALSGSSAALARLEAVVPLEWAVRALWPKAATRLTAVVEQAPVGRRGAAFAGLVEHMGHAGASVFAANDSHYPFSEHLHRPLVALARVAGCDAGEWAALLAVARETEEAAPAELLLRSALDTLAARRGVSRHALRLSINGGIARFGRRYRRRLARRQQVLGQIAVLAEMGLSKTVHRMAIGDAAVLPEPSRAVRRHAGTSRLRLAAALRARPFAVIEEYGGSLEAMVAAALAFAGAAPLVRERALALGRLLTGPAGRRAIPPEKLAQALAQAVSTADWRTERLDFGAEWLLQIEKLASLSEKSALNRLLSSTTDAIEARDAPASKAPAASAVRLRNQVGALLGLGASPAKSAVRRALADPRQRLVLVKAMTEGELAALLAWVAPGLASGLLHVAERIGSARRAAGAPVARMDQWQAVLAAATTDSHAVVRLVSMMLDGGAGCPAPPAPIRHKVEAAITRTLEGMRDAPLRIALDLRARARSKQAEREAVSTPAAEAMIWVGNAGLVLASAYLPRLFQTLGWIEADAGGNWHWIAREVQEGAPHLLQWLVDGRSDAAEPELALPKLLCGLVPSDPITPAIDLDAETLRMGRMLLGTIRANWPPLAESSTQALRETFLQRGGRLARTPEGWTLDVETKVLDILLDQLPWGYSTIAHGWMAAPLAVRWR